MRPQKHASGQANYRVALTNLSALDIYTYLTLLVDIGKTIFPDILYKYIIATKSQITALCHTASNSNIKLECGLTSPQTSFFDTTAPIQTNCYTTLCHTQKYLLQFLDKINYWRVAQDEK